MDSVVRPSKLTPAALMRSLWHPAQYNFIVARCGSGAGETDVDCGVVNATPPDRIARTAASALRIRRQVSPQALEGATHELVGVAHLLVEFLRRFCRDSLVRPASLVEQRRQ